ncbi:MAG: cation:proton antiporter [Candidatus Binatia bacterium]
MHGSAEFLNSLALVLCVAAVTTVAFQRLGQPIVLGYLLAGMMVGGHTPLPVVADAPTVHTLSELGVILLMFSLGLDFSIRRLLRAGPTATLVAVVETSLMFGLGSIAGAFLGWQGLARLHAGAMVAISSTTIVLKAFAERHMPRRQRERVFGILVGEDLIAIALIAVLTTFATGAGASAMTVTTIVGRLGGFLVAVIGVGMLIVPRAMRAIARLHRPETTLVTSIGLCFALALVADAVGYSFALGAFLAGALVGESGVEAEVARLISPVRDMFAAVFFVSVGMLIDPTLIGRHAGAVLLFLAVVVFGKIATVSMAAFLTGDGIRPAIQTGMSLAQIGEFSFILVGVGAAHGVIPDALYSIAVAVSAATALLTPWLIRASERTAAVVDRRLPNAIQTFAALYGSWIEQLRSASSAPGAWGQVRRRLLPLALDAIVLALVIIGATVERELITAWLQRHLPLSARMANALVAIGAGVIALPFVIGLLRSTRALAFAVGTTALPISSGSQLDLADAPRRALAVALQLAALLVICSPLVAVMQPFISPYAGAAALSGVIAVLGAVLWRRAANLQAHARAAAQMIVEVLAKQSAIGAAAGGDALAPVQELLPGLGTPMAVRLGSGDHGVGKTLSDLNLRGLTGATVLAISRNNASVLVPRGNEVLRAGDMLALAGPHEAIASARELLSRGPRDAGEPESGLRASDGRERLAE